MIEGFEFKSKTIEAYSFFTDSTTNPEILSGQINDLNNNIEILKHNYPLVNANPIYNRVEFPDKYDLTKTTADVRKKDLNNVILQQNYLYIVTTVSCATLLIAAIFINKH
jgi:hypothetical protein